MQYLMSQPLIGIVGPKGSGKSTLAKHLIEELEKHTALKWKRIAFGDALKNEVSELYGVPLAWLYDERKKETPLSDLIITGCLNPEWHDHVEAILGRPAKTTREVLQVHGTEIRRAEDPDYWNKLFLAQVENLPPHTGVICDDVRFIDEACMIRTLGGALIRINHFKGERDPATHRSEYEMRGMAGFDLKIRPGLGELELFAKATVDVLRGTFKRLGVWQ